MNAESVWRFGNPYLQLAVSAVLIAAAELFLKHGAVLAPEGGGWSVWLPLSSLATWIGIALYVASFLSWLHVLRLMPLNQAFALINVVHILVPLGSAFFLGETVSAMRWLGITLVLIGTVMVAAPAAVAEEML